MENKNIDLYIISFPKCGRTWLRVMMAKLLSLHYDVPLQDKDIIWINNLSRYPSVPNIHFTHDIFNSRNHFINDVPLERYEGIPLIHLYRDPRDVIVSLYYHRQKRHPEGFEQFSDLKEFIRKSPAKHDIVQFFNRWAAQSDHFESLHSINYEQLHLKTANTLRFIFELIGIKNITESEIVESIEFGRFENMRKIEENRVIDDITLQPTNAEDYATYKTRKGKMGGFVEELDESDVEYLDEYFINELDEMYNFYFDSNSRVTSAEFAKIDE